MLANAIYFASDVNVASTSGLPQGKLCVLDSYRKIFLGDNGAKHHFTVIKNSKTTVHDDYT